MAIDSALRVVTEKARHEPRPSPTEADLVSRPYQRRRLGMNPPSRATIMLVEADVMAARTLSKALECAGYSVRIAATGSAACALQPRLRPDLIILELMLPDMDGLVLTMRLRAMTDTPIIICSARHGQLDRVLGLRLGAADFVAKPFDLPDFQVRIEAVVRCVRMDQATTSKTHLNYAQRRA